MAASVSLSSEAGAAVISAPAEPAASLTPALAARSGLLDWLGVPSDPDLYGPCLETGRVRLHGRRGLLIEPASARAADDGVSYVMPAGPAGEPGSTGFLSWRELRGVDVWSPEPAAMSTTNLWSVGGYVVGLSLGFALTPRPETLRGSLGTIALIGVEGIPLGLLGRAIGKHLDHRQPGHWMSCDDTRPSELPRLAPRPPGSP